jgi:SAM-dependent methyltransferase
MLTEAERAAVLGRLQEAVDRAHAFSGWDFHHVDIRQVEPGPPWDYERVVREQAPPSGCTLDMGTGGGEVLARLRNGLPQQVVATEAWHVNAPLAYRRLRPLGVSVVRTRNLLLPFRDGSFDLIINRHEELVPSEVARVLRPRGRFVTQQVARPQLWELRRFFPRMTDFGDQRWEYARGLERAGLEITMDRQHDFKTAFRSLSDLAFLMCVTPWSVTDFDVDRDLDALLAVDRAFGTNAGIVLTESRYLIVAQKPA